MSTEEWRPVIGYEGLYEVSSLGRVRSLDQVVKYKDGRTRLSLGRVRRLSVSSNGYLTVGLCDNKLQRTKTVHRLVARAFIPNLKGKPEVNHKDGDKTNNHASNLEWVTRQENIRHAIDTGLNRHQGTSHTQAKLSEEEVKEIKLLLTENSLSQRAIAARFNVSQSAIFLIGQGKRWKGI